MFKKILCLVMALMMVASLAVIGVSAASEDVAEVSADTKFYFEVPSNWKNYKTIYCHIWPYGEDPLANWQSKKEKCTLESDGKYSYDPAAKVGALSSGTKYCIIFSADTGMQTYDAITDTTCLGDTLYCDGTIYENPQDSSKTCQAAFWRGKSASQYGPLLQVTSIGNLIGTCLPPGVTAEDLFNSFLTDWLDSARTYSGKTDQQIIDDMAKSLGLSQANVDKLIKASGKDIKWEMAKSSAPTVNKGYADKTSSGSGSGSAANSASVTTGQEMTIVYIAVAMMIASAAVVFFARRKRVTE